MSIQELDDNTRAIIRDLADKHGCTVEELLSAVLRSMPRATTDGDSLLGLMSTEPELMDKVLASAYEGRLHPLRPANP